MNLNNIPAGFWDRAYPCPITGCWHWAGARRGLGYTKFLGEYGHRYIYENAVGPIPNGLVIDHKCRNRNCVNPLHLRPVTSKENNLCGIGPAAIHAAQTTCIRGHELATLQNGARKGKRHCKACNATRMRERKLRQAA